MTAVLFSKRVLLLKYSWENKLYVKTIADQTLLNCRCEIWMRYETKFDHYNFTGLTEQNIQYSFHFVLEICRMRRPRVFKSRCRDNSKLYTVIHEMHEQNVMIT